MMTNALVEHNAVTDLLSLSTVNLYLGFLPDFYVRVDVVLKTRSRQQE